jgi:hypothetical protein
LAAISRERTALKRPGAEFFQARGIFTAAAAREPRGFRVLALGMESASQPRREASMNTESQVVVDRPFERALEAVLEAFVREGFAVDPLEAGRLQFYTFPGDLLRYARIEASLPELSFSGAQTAANASSDCSLLGCRISLYELTGSCTLVTAENALLRYPLLASLVPRVTRRIASALRELSRVASSSAAA